MNVLVPSSSGELQEASRVLVSQDPRLRLDGMRQVIALFAHGENCISVQPQTSTVSGDDNVLMHRFANILNEEYAVETGCLSVVVRGVLADFEKPSPLVKALAVRQAGALASPETAEQLLPVIVRGAASPDPYVRKAAALAVLKAQLGCRQVADHFELPKVLRRLLDDPNPNVAANAVAALAEINSARRAPFVAPTMAIVSHVLAGIADAGEWAQVQILDFVSEFVPDSVADAKLILQQIETRLIQANPAVTMAAVRCFLRMNLVIGEAELVSKILPPLVALLNNGREIELTVLKSISVVIQKYRGFFRSDVSLFLCKFDDPLYIKLEKLEIILSLTTKENIAQVLDELNSYAHQDDMEFVQKSIRVIGRLAIVFEEHARSCVDCLVSLIQSRIHYVVQECIVISVNIFRRYPNKYEHIITKICQSLNHNLDDHRAKAAMVWILGEYSHIITNAAELMDELFLDDFLEEATDVQLSILTAVVKFFLSNPDEGQDMLKRVLSLATSEVDNPDLNDRAYTYLCLLTECADRARDIVLADAERPVIAVDLRLLEPRLVDALVPLIGTLSVIYGKFPQEFVPSIRNRPLQKPPRQPPSPPRRQPVLPIEHHPAEPPAQISTAVPAQPSNPPSTAGTEVDEAQPPAELRPQFVELESGDRVLQISVANTGQTRLTVQQVVVDRNPFSLAVAALDSPVLVEPDASEIVSLPVAIDSNYQGPVVAEPKVCIAVKVDRPSPVYLDCPFALRFLLVEDDALAAVSHAQFVDQFANAEGIPISALDIDVPAAKAELVRHRLYCVCDADGEFVGRTIGRDIFALAFADGQIVFMAPANRQIGQAVLALVVAALRLG
jgi:vesicle coat complex subunit